MHFIGVALQIVAHTKACPRARRESYGKNLQEKRLKLLNSIVHKSLHRRL
jgi:hypothetical protein